MGVNDVGAKAPDRFGDPSPSCEVKERVWATELMHRTERAVAAQHATTTQVGLDPLLMTSELRYGTANRVAPVEWRDDVEDSDCQGEPP